MFQRPFSVTDATSNMSQTLTTHAHDYHLEDPLSPCDLLGNGLLLQGELVIDSGNPSADSVFEVVRKLGTGSYAVVYLVRELLSRPQSPQDDCPFILDDPPVQPVYGREFAIKCLSKANLDADSLSAQRLEATIHQSLPIHPNIVSLHSTLESHSFLMLLLEYVPGEDLFYFLEQAKDHQLNPESAFPLSSDSKRSISSDSSPFTSTATSAPQAIPPSSPPLSPLANTPPTPTLLAASHPSQLLSHRRLRLISSMFSQMCDALATCHQLGVFHRDIKPENFIVTDGFVALDDGRRDRKVVVKLTDFGLATSEEESSDMDCGSAPYMSYECRNNCAPTYSPRQADVWSLGIVLINMLYHHNPWSDTADGVCKSFKSFRSKPVPFFMQRFNGMTSEVAEFLANKVFCIFEDMPESQPKQRVSAAEFGAWVKELPALMGSPPYRPLSQEAKPRSVLLSTPVRPTVDPPIRIGFVPTPAGTRVSIPKGPVPPPATRTSLVSAGAPTKQSQIRPQSYRDRLPPPPPLSTTLSLPAPQHQNRRRLSSSASDMPPTPDLAPHSASASSDGMRSPPALDSSDAIAIETPAAVVHCRNSTEPGTMCVDDGACTDCRSTSNQKRRKRGRKGKAAKEASLALSRPNTSDGSRTIDSRLHSDNPPRTAFEPWPNPFEPWSPPPLSRTFTSEGDHLEDLAKASQALAREISRAPKSPKTPSSASITLVVDAPPVPPIIVDAISPTESPLASPTPVQSPVKKSKSPWSMFRRADSNTEQPVPIPVSKPSPTVQHVTNTIMGLNPSTVSLVSVSTPTAKEEAPTANGSMSWRSKRKETKKSIPSFADLLPVAPMPLSMSDGRSPAPKRTTGSNGVYQAAQISPASSSYNWRQSTSSFASSQNSAFTRFSNGSVRSVSTTATSVSSGSWRVGLSPGIASKGDLRDKSRPVSPVSPTSPTKPKRQQAPLPANVKRMDGIPWELHEVPRQMYYKPKGVVFDQPPVKSSKRTVPPRGLDSIPEREKAKRSQSPSSERQQGSQEKNDATVGEDGLKSSPSSPLDGETPGFGEAVPKKVKQGQIHALGKMLSSFKSR